MRCNRDKQQIAPESNHLFWACSTVANEVRFQISGVQRFISLMIAKGLLEEMTLTLRTQQGYWEPGGLIASPSSTILWDNTLTAGCPEKALNSKKSPYQWH